ncbi:MAG: type II toxin-antitoxin system MqsA family antitoxin [Desulfomonilaceae bacterium]
MTCVICKHGVLRSGKTTVVLQRASTSVIIKEVPAEICDNCGEYYLDSDIAANVLQLAENAVQRKSEVEIVRFAA